MARVRPNPSFEARPNGKPPGPGRWYAYIFTGPGLASCRWSRLNSNVRLQNAHAFLASTCLSLALLSATWASAQWIDRQGRALPQTPSMKSDGNFGAQLVLTTDEVGFRDTWNKATSTPQL